MSTTYKKLASFVREIYGVEDATIPLHEPRFWGNEKKYVESCIDSTFVSSVGEFVDRFEREFADYCGSKHAVAVVNGTSALQLALELAGVERNDEVITQSLTFVGTCNAIVHSGAKPVFVDVDFDSMSLSPNSLREWLATQVNMTSKGAINVSTGARVSACMPMHTLGHCARMNDIVEICEPYGIKVVEDAAEALGSRIDKHAGTYGLLGAFSFNGNKVITTGGGGMIVTDDDKLALRAKHLSTTAKVKMGNRFVHDQVAYNLRMPNINAALGCAQLEQLSSFLSVKSDLAERSQIFLKDLDGIDFVNPREGTQANNWLNAVLVDNITERDKLLSSLTSENIQARPLWDLIHTLPMFESCEQGDLQQSIALYQRIVNIPSSVTKGC